ncbi:m160 protein [Murid betaherpesvirus 1]|nr:m160 protein [Murid betaherpesvirus 1]
MQIQNVIPSRRIARSASGLEVTVWVDKTEFTKVTYSCNSTSSSSGSDSTNLYGKWSITCKGTTEETLLATFGGSSGKFVKKHTSVTGGSSKTTIKLNLSGSSSEESNESDEEESGSSKSGPSSTLIMKPICEGNITCKIGNGDNYDNAATHTVQTLGPLDISHFTNRTSTGTTDAVVASCRPKTFCDSFNVTWYNSSTASVLGTGTFFPQVTGKGSSQINNTQATDNALKWVGGSVQLNGALWDEDETRQFCLSCKVDTCGLVGMSLVCKGGTQSAYQSSGPRLSAPSLYHLLFLILGVFLIV